MQNQTVNFDISFFTPPIILGEVKTILGLKFKIVDVIVKTVICEYVKTE